MSNSLAFYSDAGLTVPLARLDAAQAVDGSAAAVDRVVWLGSPVPGTAFMADSDPGVDPLVVAIVDAATGLQIDGRQAPLTEESLPAGAQLALFDALAQLLDDLRGQRLLALQSGKRNCHAEITHTVSMQ